MELSLYQRRILRQGRGTAISLALGPWINRPVLLGNVSLVNDRSARTPHPAVVSTRACSGTRRVLEDRGGGVFTVLKTFYNRRNLAAAALDRSIDRQSREGFLAFLFLALSLNFANIQRLTLVFVINIHYIGNFRGFRGIR